MSISAISKYGLVVIAGAIAAFAFAPVALWWMMPISVGVFVFLVRSQPWSRAGTMGLLYGLAFCLPLLHWSGSYVGNVPWLALSTLQALFFVPLAMGVARTNSAWVVGALWVAEEAVRARWPWGGFGWGRVAFSQVDAPYSSVVTIGGPSLLTFLVVVVTTGVVYRSPTSLILLVLPVGLALTTSNATEMQRVRVAAVQGNVPRLGLDFNAQREAVLTNHLTAMEKIPRASVDLVVLPENASDIDPFDVATRIQRAVDRVEAPVIIGGVPVIDGKLLNASILWLPFQGPQSVYVKQHLAPFGEYMPLRGVAESLVPEAKRVVDFTPGTSVVLHRVSTIRVGAVICFEILDDELMRQVVDRGANLLAVQTNSATFGRSAESAQQLAITRLRAIEHARSVVSVSTSGISALISPRGEVLDKSGIFEEAILIGSLPLSNDRTVSDRLGGWAEVSLVALPIALSAGRRLRRRKDS